ncbi:MAG TPA: Ig-like domain-containing protein [Candidatus Angelobacter sp.]|jgi:hypothetical protein
MQWIVANRAALNIQAVLGEGDIVNDGASIAQQQNADAAIRTLDAAGIPYLLAIGNHDYDGANPKAGRPVVGFNQWFGPTRYAGKPFYMGNFPTGSNENFYGIIPIAEKNFLLMALEYYPRSEAMDWATSILQANPDKEAIIVTHNYEFVDGSRESRCDTQDMPSGNATGDDMWATLRQFPNVIMVLSGHLTDGQSAHRTDIADTGTLVNQMFINYQTFPNGGDGWLRILTFHPSTNSISAQTYSPFLNQFRTDAANQFTLLYHNPNPSTGMGTIGGKIRNSTTCAAIPGINVSLSGASATTASDGTYSLSVPPAAYSVSASGPGWISSTQKESVVDSLGTNLNFYLTACTLNSVSPSVTICGPTDGATVSSPVPVVAGTTDANSVSFVQVYVDGLPQLTKTGGTLNDSVAIAPGTHRFTVQAKDSTGTVFKQTISISVAPAPVGSCSINMASPTVTICTPANNSTVASPVHIVAGSTDTTNTIKYIQVYVDGAEKFTQTGGKLDTSVTMASGVRRLTVQATDGQGIVFKQTLSVTVQ